MATPTRHLPLWLLFGLLLALGLGYVILPSNATTWKLATSHQPDGFTELYFTHYDPTTKFVHVGQKYKINYSLVNRQNKNMHYVIKTEVLGTKPVSQRTININLADNQKTTQSIEFIPTQKNLTYQVKVSITSPHVISGPSPKPQTLIWRFKS